jgi:hypothetical protein
MVTDPDARRQALNAFLDDRTAQGFRVESRGDTQAIIVRPRRAFGVFDRVRGKRDDTRQVVSVDEHGVVTERPAEPVRW